MNGFNGPAMGMNMIQCSECGYMHPALPEGKVCPMAKQKTPSGDEIDLDKFFINLRNILIANIKKGDVKNYKKLLAVLLIKVNKFVEKYVDEINSHKST